MVTESISEETVADPSEWKSSARIAVLDHLKRPIAYLFIRIVVVIGKLFAATLLIAAGTDTDASIDDTTTPSASDLHGRLLTWAANLPRPILNVRPSPTVGTSRT